MKYYLPSNLTNTRVTQNMGAFNNTYKNTALRAGYIIKKYDVGSEESKSPEGIPTYDVEVVEKDGQNGISSATYSQCIHVDAIGGLADFLTFSLRVNKEALEGPQRDPEQLQDGTAVLILCLDGFSESGIIIGGFPREIRRQEETVQDGHKMMYEFNGMNISINNDGALSIVRRGATDNKGLPLDASGGSRVLLEKDGSIELNDGKLKHKISNEAIHQEKDPREINTEKKYDKIRIDGTKQAVEIEAQKDISLTSKGTFNNTVEKDATYKINGAFKLESAKTVDFKSGNTFNVESAADLNLKAGSSLVIDSPMTQIKGSLTTTGQTNLAGGGLPFIQQILLISGVGNLGAPVISQAVVLTTTQVTGS